MKHCILFILTAIIIGSCGKEAETPGVVVSLDLTRYEVTDIPGTDFQNAVKRDENGNILEEGIVRNGKRNGIWITYHLGAKEFPETISSFVDDVYSGPYFKLNNRGQIEEKRGYLNNNLDGRWAKYKSGRTQEEATYKNGNLHGIYRSYYNYSDKTQKVINYQDGLMHGASRFFNEDGKLVMEYEYNKGQKVSGGMVETPDSNVDSEKKQPE